MISIGDKLEVLVGHSCSKVCDWRVQFPFTDMRTAERRVGPLKIEPVGKFRYCCEQKH